MLKRLDIQGFKSFANKTQIEFLPGLTVIVGPNGSGKSNIADAINWVLGEQRPGALRGTRMDDIIFAGSDQRRRVGMCTVAVTLDNSTGCLPLEYAEVTVTRRLFRSGESQFMINKTPCRLKDIHNLLLDTGIGRGAYAIIGQGKVDQILHSHPAERRAVIEEAAGIVKYRQQKEAALKKLTVTGSDLVRLGDIIDELALRLQPLVSEAAKVRQWQQYTSELKQLELSLLVREGQAIAEKLTSLKKQLNHFNHNQQNIDKQLAALVLQLEVQLQHKNMNLEDYRSHTEKINSEVQQIKQQLMLDQQKQQSDQQEQQRLLRQKKEIIVKLQILEQEKDQETANLKRIKTLLTRGQQTLQQLQQHQEKLLTGLQQQTAVLADNQAQVIDLMNTAAQGRTKLQQAKERQAVAKRRLDKRNADYRQTKIAQGQLQEKLTAAQHLTRQWQKELATTRSTLLQSKESQSRLNSDLEQQQNDIRQLRENLAAAKSKYRVLAETLANYTGYQRGVRELLLAVQKKRLALKGLRGTVAEILQVPPNLEQAVETVLGGALQNLVADTDTDAKQAIAYLKQNKLGRVTFLPLNTLRAAKRQTIEKEALGQPGVLGVAADLVQCQSCYQVVIEFLLGKVLVLTDIEQALKVARTAEQRLRLVTLTGEYLHPGGSLTGGTATGPGRGLLKIKREKEAYAVKIAGWQQTESELVAVATGLNEKLNQVAQTTAGLENKAIKLQVALAGKEQELVQLQQAIEQFTVQNQANRYESTNLVAEIEHQTPILENTTGQIAVAKTDTAIIATKIETQQQQLENIKKEEQQIARQITDAKVIQASTEQQQTGTSKLLNRLTSEINEHQTNLTAAKKAIADLALNQAQMQQKIKQKEVQLSQKRTQLQNQQQRGQTLQNEQAALLKQQQQARQQKQAQVEKAEKQREQAHHWQLQQARLETKHQNLLTRLADDYQIKDIAQLAALPAPDTGLCSTRILKLKKLLTELGPVNQAAETEYQQVQTRYQYLLKQKQDLDQSKQSLENLISEMAVLMSGKFSQIFKEIEKKFRVIFQELFGGGTAAMHLTGDDPLAAGIEIEARPPGKKLQNISLLSGGERALTAIALLFAILKVSPSPFCVLDEIDAALDETNVQRFAQFLLEFSQQMPFVVISHRKGTMEQAEILYGVTMDASGTSKLFSLKMNI